MKIQTLTLFCTAVFALTAITQNATALSSESHDIKSTWRSRIFWRNSSSSSTAEPRDTDHVKVGHDLHAIGTILGRVNSRRSADAAAKKLHPFVRDLRVQFRHEEARRTLPRDHHERLVANIHAVDLHIVNLRRESFYGSTSLARVSHEIEQIFHPVTQSRRLQPEIKAGTEASRTMPSSSVLAPRPTPPPTTLPPLLPTPRVR